MTLAQLMRHTSGMPRSVLDYVRGGIGKRYSLSQLMHGLEKARLEFEPGERFQYSNAGYTILAAVVSEASGKSYEDFLRERIFEPAGLVETHFDFPEQAVEEDALGYYATSSGKLHRARKISMSFAIGAGTFRTTPTDMLRWDATLRSNRVLSAQTRALMATPSVASRAYAFAWGVGSYRRSADEGSGLRLHHGGGIDGFTTSLVRLVDDGIVIMAMANLANAPCEDLTSQVQRVLERDAEPGGVDRVQLALREGGLEQAGHVFDDLGHNSRGLLAGAEQMIGESDATSSDSYGCCWFPEDRDGADVIDLGYDRAVLPVRVEIHGTGSQGGLTALRLRAAPSGEWHTVALKNPVIEPGQDGLGTTTFSVTLDAEVDAVQLEVDSGLIEGSNVIDALALVSADGVQHWATSATATSDRRALAWSMVPDAPTSRALDARARHLLDAGCAEDALLLARFNAARNADAWRVQATLGRAQRATDDLAAAIASLERALALKPDDRAERKNLTRELKQLRGATR